MRWLDEKEAAAAPPLGSPKGPPPADAAQRSPGALVDGAPTRHQELAEARAALLPAAQALCSQHQPSHPTLYTSFEQDKWRFSAVALAYEA